MASSRPSSSMSCLLSRDEALVQTPPAVTWAPLAISRGCDGRLVPTPTSPLPRIVILSSEPAPMINVPARLCVMYPASPLACRSDITARLLLRL